MRACLLLAALVLSGCASSPPIPNRINPNADRDADSEQCERNTFARYPNAPATGMQCVTSGVVTNCQPTYGGGGSAFDAGYKEQTDKFKRREMLASCMVAKGW